LQSNGDAGSFTDGASAMETAHYRDVIEDVLAFSDDPRRS
jgi:hypothetical protein